MLSKCILWKRALIMSAIAVLVAGSGCRKERNPFPASDAVAGWQKTDATRTFAAKDLWQYIDGDAEHFVKAGVVTTSTADYTYNGQLEAVVDVHAMSAPEGAHTIFATGRSSEAKPIQLGDEGVQYAQSVSFRKGRYVVHIVAYETKPDAPQALVALARGVESRL